MPLDYLHHVKGQSNLPTSLHKRMVTDLISPNLESGTKYREDREGLRTQALVSRRLNLADLVGKTKRSSLNSTATLLFEQNTAMQSPNIVSHQLCEPFSRIC